ncbi:MAG: hypothetical protein OWQ56_06465 [Acidithiobacillus caldus]|nr:hypothetical protein [Acidithiobacillus caldus]
MSAYLVGNLLGRLLVAWVLVFLVSLAFCRRRWRRALRASVWPWGWIFVLLLFFLGLAGAFLHSSGGTGLAGLS